MKSIKKVLAILVMTSITVAFAPMIGEPAHAAGKNPAAPRILSAREITNDSDSDKIVIVKWVKVKKAKQYQVAIRSADKKWVKVKTVKKTAKNKKKYTKKNKYRVVASGKKYKVYQYTYKYTRMGSTKGASFRFVEAPGWEPLQPNTAYVFAVRSVNGKKYSSWSTVSVKTSAPGWEQKLLASPGQQLTQSINGRSVTITVGKSCVLPVPNPTKAKTEAATTFEIIPRQVEYQMDRSTGIVIEYISVSGTSTDGISAHWRIFLESSVCTRVDYYLKDTEFNQDWSKYKINSWRDASLKQCISLDPDVTIAWTVDGTEPGLDLESKTIDGSEYPFAPYSGRLRVRDIVTEGTSSIWSEIKGIVLFSRSEWIRVYNGDKLVEERYLITRSNE